MPPAHPDHGARRIVLGGLTTVSAVVLLLSYRTSTSSAMPDGPATTDVDTSAAAAAVAAPEAVAPEGTTPSPGASGSGAPDAAAPGATTPAARPDANAPVYDAPAPDTAPPEAAAPDGGTAATAAASSKGSWSGTVTGPVVPIKWGEVQVRATIARGRITAVDVLRHPDENARDRQVNAGAVPVLVRETLAAQSARIDMVSGATYTSTGYVQSLQAALDHAGTT